MSRPLDCSALKQCSKVAWITRAIGMIIIYGATIALSAFLILSILPVFGHECMSCGGAYYGKPGVVIDDHFKYCQECVSKYQWAARQFLGGEYLHQGKVDAKFTHTWQSLLKGMYYEEQTRGK